MEYWNECIKEAFEDAGINATDDQINTVVSWVEGAHENYGMAFGHDCISNPLKEENEKLQQQLKIEQEKRICGKCKGSGIEVTYGPYHSSMSSCYKCNGEGYIYNS